jgi:hypothetical protein
MYLQQYLAHPHWEQGHCIDIKAISSRHKKKANKKKRITLATILFQGPHPSGS